MKTRNATLLSTLFIAAALSVACAPQQDAKAPVVAGPIGEDVGLESVRDAVTRALPDISRDAVSASDIQGLYQLRQGGHYGYITADGQYLIDGDLIDLASRTNLTENKRKEERVTQLATLGTENLIVFAPEKPEASRVVTVFTDIDCGYCRKLHREIEDYNAKGITIQYAFYPRSGPNTDSFRKAETVWCSDDRKEALTLAKNGAQITGSSDCENPITREYALGGELGLRGTPMMILPDGEVINGYVPAAALAVRLSERKG